LKTLSKDFFLKFISSIKKQIEKKSNLIPFGWRGDSNHQIAYFSFKILCNFFKNINHNLVILNKYWKYFSCWALSYNCVEIDTTFNSLFIFYVCLQKDQPPLFHT
jgi:hypothetical protein